MNTPENQVNPLTWFWGTIIFLALCLLLISLIIFFKNQNIEETRTAYIEKTPTKLNIPRTKIEKIIHDAADVATQKTIEKFNKVVNDSVYAEVYSGVEIYADYHFSLIGQYSELTQAAFGNIEEEAKKIIFNGFDSRVSDMLNLLDEEFKTSFKEEIEKDVAEELAFSSFELLAEPTEIAIENTFTRMQSTVPLATSAVILVSSGALKGSLSAFLSSITTKILASTATKLAVKGSSVAGGALTGALSCAWAGPIAAVCGVAGGVATWFAIDATVMEIDEYINRDEFEKELRTLVDKQKQDFINKVEEIIINRKLAVQKGSQKMSISEIPKS
jgi:hypothetical protein